MTVVVESGGGRTWVGRYHERTDSGVILRDAAAHDAATTSQPRDAWIERQIKFGIQAEARHLLVPSDQATRIVRLMDWKPAIVKRP